MSNPIGCNLNSYLSYKASAFEHLGRIGLTNVEISLPGEDEVESVKSDLNAHGLTALSLMVPCQLNADDCVHRFAKSLEIVEALGVKQVFTSVKSGEIDLDYVYGRLGDIGDAAGEKGVMVVLETHPDLATNGEIARRTMEGVNHPNVRINFDTANVCFYNEGATTVAELGKVIDYVASVHLKETDGGYRSWHFPALGEGAVDFPRVFQMLGDRGYSGPYILELEGIEDEAIDEAGVQRRIETSLEFLSAHGLW